MKAFFSLALIGFVLGISLAFPLSKDEGEENNAKLKGMVTKR